jgi:hypothetical protein
MGFEAPALLAGKPGSSVKIYGTLAALRQRHQA